MNQIALIETRPDVRDLLMLLIEFYDVPVVQYESLAEFFEAKKNSDTVMIIYGFPAKENVAKYFDWNGENEHEIPLLIVCDDNTLNKARKTFPHHPLIQIISYNLSAKVLSSVIGRWIRLGKNQIHEKAGYFKVPVKYLYHLEEVPYDLYIKMADNLFIRILNRGDQVDLGSFEKYAEKEHDHMYTKLKDYKKFTQEVLVNLGQKLALKNLRSKELIHLTTIAHDSFYQTINKLGLSDDAVQMADSAIHGLLKINEKNDLFKEIIKDFASGESYLTEHSLMLAFVSVAVAKEMGPANDMTAFQLTTAAFFHDIALDSDTSPYAPKKIQEYELHPLKAMELLEQIEGIPAEVGHIIKVHHENPLGTGFPGKLNFKKIDLISAIFIVSEAFVDAIYENDLADLNIMLILEDLEKEFCVGHYWDAVLALKKIYQGEDIEEIKAA